MRLKDITSEVPPYPQNINEAVIEAPEEWINSVMDLIQPYIKAAILNAISEDENLFEQWKEELNYDRVFEDDKDDFLSSGKKIKNDLLLKDIHREMKIGHDLYIDLYIGKSKQNVIAYVTKNKQSKDVLFVSPISLLMSTITKFNKIIDENTNVNELYKIMYDTAKNVIEHELIHIHQDYVSTEKQKKFNKNYERDTNEYYKSPVEYNTQINSLIREFERRLNELSDEQLSTIGKSNITLALRYFMSDYSSSPDDKDDKIFKKLSSPKNKFMNILKDEKRTAWEKATKSVLKYFENKK